jgi:hypothetical protein
VYPEDPGLAPILRAIVSLGAVSDDAPTGSIARAFLVYVFT